MLKLQEYKKHSWISVDDPTQEELEQIAERFNLDISLLQDAVDKYELPRLEVEDGVLYIFTRFAYNQNDTILTSPMMIAVHNNFIITVSPIKFPRLERLLNGKISFNTVQKPSLLINLLTQIVTTYKNHVNFISKRILSTSLQNENIHNRDIIQFINYENILYDLNSSLVRLDNIFKYIFTGKVIKLTEDEMDTIEDLSLESGQLAQITKDTIRNIVNIREAYSTILTNNLNRVIKLFTSLTIILTLPTIVGTFYGMNVALPFAQNPYAFFGILGITILLSLIALIIFIRNDWL